MRIKSGGKKEQKEQKEQNLAVVGHARLVFVPPRNESVLCSVVQKETAWPGIPSLRTGSPARVRLVVLDAELPDGLVNNVLFALT
jgi:hypothetical protein